MLAAVSRTADHGVRGRLPWDWLADCAGCGLRGVVVAGPGCGQAHGYGIRTDEPAGRTRRWLLR